MCGGFAEPGEQLVRAARASDLSSQTEDPSPEGLIE